MFDLCLRIVSVPDIVPRAYARLLGEEIRNLYSFWLGNQLFMIVSDPAIAKDLMVTNGSVFSSRKEMFIKSQTVLLVVALRLVRTMTDGQSPV
jgi:hypothetical protein